MKIVQMLSPLPTLAFLFFTHLIIFFAFRLGLFYFVYPFITDHESILNALYIGLKFDARQVVFLTLITSICLIIPPFERLLVNSRIFRYLICLWQTLVFAFMLCVYVVDFGVYFYLNQRVDLTLVDLLKEADIGFTMVWQSYPVIWIGLAFLFVLIGYFLFWNRTLRNRVPRKIKRKKNIRTVETCACVSTALCLRTIAIILLVLAGIGQISSNLFPLRWSNAYLSTDKNISLIAINPIQNLYDTIDAVSFIIPDEKYAKEAYPRMAEQLNVPKTNNVLDFTRSYVGEKSEKPLNIVVIMMESWTTPKASLPHGTGSKKGFEDHTKYPEGYDIDPTPFAEKMLEDSLYYSNFYANSRTTARGIMSTLTGIPDVNFSASTTSRNPKMIDQHLIFNDFKGYEKYYMIGGSANWANIRGVFKNNIEDLHILEESFWKAPNTDVWGISDLALLRESIGVFNQSKKPFIAFIQTAGYHRPFTIPEDREDFQLAPEPSKEVLKAWGFANAAEYQSLRFVDYAIQRFFERAKKTDWYEDTVFVLFGDHGTIEFNGTMNDSYLTSWLHFWHTPFFIHSPKYVKAGINPALHSQKDIYPTLASMAGISYKNTTLGEPMLKKTEDNMFVPREFAKVEKNGQTEYVFDKDLDNKFNNHAYIAVYDGDGLLLKDNFAYTSTIKAMDGSKDVLRDISKDSKENIIKQYPEIAKEMLRLSRDYYYISKYLFLHNKKQK